MMKKVYENKFVVVYSDATNKYARFNWKEETVTMDDTGFREVIGFWVSVSPYACLVDSREFNYTMSLEIQEWLNSEVYPEIYKRGSRKVAMLVPNDLISSIAVEQLSDLSKQGGTVILQYFSKEADALAWITSNNAVEVGLI